MGLVGVRRLSALAALLVIQGCAFRTTVFNPFTADLDPAWIEPGTTTWVDVLDRWGPPMPRTSEALTTELPTLRYFRYTKTVTKTFVVFIPPMYLILPWSWTDEQRTREVMVEFDDAGVVSDAYVRTEDAIWPPFESEADREPGRTTFVTPTSAK